MRPAILFASLIIAATPALAAVKLSPKQLVKNYRTECVSNMKTLKGMLTAGKVKVKGTKEMAAKSKELFCSFEADNPTIKQINDARWLKAQNEFISKKGVESYVLSTQAVMKKRIMDSRVDEVMARGKKEGLTPVEIAFLGQITRAMAFAEAHVTTAVTTKK
jgi:hypothetical protein